MLDSRSLAPCDSPSVLLIRHQSTGAHGLRDCLVFGLANCAKSAPKDLCNPRIALAQVAFDFHALLLSLKSHTKVICYCQRLVPKGHLSNSKFTDLRKKYLAVYGHANELPNNGGLIWGSMAGGADLILAENADPGSNVLLRIRSTVGLNAGWAARRGGQNVAPALVRGIA